MSAAYEQFRKLMTTGRFGEAAQLAESEYLKGSADNPFWLTRQAAALSRAGQYEPALNSSRRALALQPSNAFAVLAADEALRGLKRTEEALLHFQDIAADPKVSFAARRGVLECLLELKQWHRILELLERWGLPPEKTYRWRVQALAGQQRWDEAVAACRQWLKAYPDHPSALWTMTQIEVRRETGFSSEDVDRLKMMRRFLNREAEHFVFVNHYLQHAAVVQAASDDADLASLRTDVMQLLARPERLITEESGTARLNETFDQFRAAYAECYCRQHAAHYRSFEKKSLSRFAGRAYSLLKRLSAIEALDRPPGLPDLFRQIEPSRPEACQRNLAEELLRSPVCSCGFVPGQTQLPAQLEDPASAIESGLNQYLAILRAPEVGEAIAARAFALADADPATARRLRSLKRFLEEAPASATTLLDLLDDTTAGEVSRALAGRVSIEKRSLKDLITHLAGRRLAPNQVREVVAQWISKTKETAVIAIGEAEPADEGGTASFSWWPGMHPELFPEGVYSGGGEIETALERQYPAAQLRDKLSALDDSRLVRFIAQEPFHAQAIRTAWLALAERILSGAAWPDAAGIDSRHADRELAGRIRQRLKTLQRIRTLETVPLPGRLRTRLPLSEIWLDPWVTQELRNQVSEKIQTVALRGAEWLTTLPAIGPIDLDRDPLVLLIDGVSPDVWLESQERLKAEVADGQLTWSRLEVPPKTAAAVAGLCTGKSDRHPGVAHR